MKTKWTTKAIPSQAGRRAVITGANSGIGFEAALALAHKGGASATWRTVGIHQWRAAIDLNGERQQLQELVRDSPSAAEIVFSTMSTRTRMAQDMARATPSSRAYVIGSKYDPTCRAIRAFLGANRIQYNWRLRRREQTCVHRRRRQLRWSGCGLLRWLCGRGRHARP